MKYFWFVLTLLLLAACSLTTSAPPTPPPGKVPPPTKAHPSTVAPASALPTAAAAKPTSTPEPAPEETHPTAPAAYVLFSINVQDFAYPAESAAVLAKIITLHEETGIPVDIYLTDQMAAIFAADYPDLWARLKTSPAVAISYHTRPPRPYASGPDWLGLKDMSPNDLYTTILRYETYAVDPVTGETTDESGGYQGVAELIGYPPYAASALSGDPHVSATAVQVFAELGAQMTLTHGKALNLGDTKNGLPVRPEHVEIKLFEKVGEEATAIFEAALAQAQASTQKPAFIGVKIHDNDFFATQSAWTTVYIQDRRRPPWNPDLKAPLLSPAEQEAVWALYEATVGYAAAHPDKVTAVNLPLVLEMLK